MEVAGESQVYWITQRLAIGPRRSADGPSMEQLRKLGFREVIDLNADEEERREASRRGLEYHGLGIADESSIEDWLAVMFRATEIIEVAHRAGNPVFLHCTFAVGRSPTVAMAYLVFNGQSVDQAIDLVKQKRPDTWNLGNPVTKYKAILNAFWMQLEAQRSP
jgi:protein-tyrosine phosphatase